MSCGHYQPNKVPKEISSMASDQLIDSLMTDSDGSFKPGTRKEDLFDNYLKEAVAVAKNSGNRLKLAAVYNHLAKRYRNVSEYAEAISYFQQSLTISTQLHNEKLHAYTIHEMAVTFRRIDDNAQALKLHLQALGWAESAKDTFLMHSSLNGIGNVYLSYNNIPEAINYFQRSLNYIGTINHNYLGEAINTDNIGEAWLMLGNSDSALFYLQKSYEINRKIDSQIGQAICKNGMGNVFVYLKNYQKALDYFKASLEINRKIGDLIYVADNLSNMGQTYLTIKQYDNAEKYLKEAAVICEDIGSKMQISTTAKSLAQLYEEIGNPDLANVYLKKVLTYQDSITEEVSKQNSLAMDVVYKAEQQEREIVILRQQAELNQLKLSRQKFVLITGISILLLFILGILFLLRQRRLKGKLNEILLEQKLFRAQVNPHFIFNSLAAVQHFIMQNDKETASSYLVDFSRLMRNTLMGSRTDFIALSNEVELLGHYLRLQKLRARNKFEYTIQVDENIDPAICVIPPMLIQPFVENAVEHGINGIGDKGLIELRFTKNEKNLLIEVEDNGKGITDIKSEKKTGEDHVSLATKITRERMTTLQRLTKRPFKLEIINKSDFSDETGVLIKILIPYREDVEV